MKQILLLLTVLLGIQVSAQITLEKISTYSTGLFDESGAEIVFFDENTNQIFYVNANKGSVEVLNASDVNNLTLVNELVIPAEFSEAGGANSVTVAEGIVAVAVQNVNKQDSGFVALFNTDGDFLNIFQVGCLPDMITQFDDLPYFVCANEGEPNDEYTIDPPGNISLVPISQDYDTVSVEDVITYDFSPLDDIELPENLRLNNNPGNSTPSQDMEPEYLIPFANGQVLISLQEQNAYIILDLFTGQFSISSWGFVDHSVEGFGIDPSDKDDKAEVRLVPTRGLRMPDAVKSAVINGETFVFTANEGDARDYDGYSEEVRIKDANLDPTNFPNAAELQADENLGRLALTTASGDSDGDGDIDTIYTYGTRSFTIFDSALELVFDSGDDFEQIIIEENPENFGSTNDENGSFDSRSDAKGPEPEAIEIGTIDGKSYAFIGLERIGGIMIYDVTVPAEAFFVDYVNNRDFSVPADELVDGVFTVGDLGIEDIKFVASEVSPNGKDILVTGNEVTGTVTIFEIKEPETNTSISEINQLQIHPNPTSNYIATGIRGSFQVLDMTGKVVKTVQNVSIIGVSELENGTYILQDTVSGNTAQFVKQ